jgi:hypothetical protein
MGSMSASDAAPLPRLGEVYFDVRGESRSMRLSWYADTGVAVFSIWQGGTCTGTFRLPIADLPRMVQALQRGPEGNAGGEEEQRAGQARRGGPAPEPAHAPPDSDIEAGQDATVVHRARSGRHHGDDRGPAGYGGAHAGEEPSTGYRDELGPGYPGGRSSSRHRDELTAEYEERPGAGYSGSGHSGGHRDELGERYPDGRRTGGHRAAPYADEPTGVYRSDDDPYADGEADDRYGHEPAGRYRDDGLPGGYHDDGLPGGYHDDGLPGGYRDDSLPGGYHDDGLPGGYHDDGLPGGYRDDSLPEGYHDDSLPRHYHDDSLPGGHEQDAAGPYPGDPSPRYERERAAAYSHGGYDDEPTGVYRGDLLHESYDEGGRYAERDYPGDPLGSDYPTGPSAPAYPGAGDARDYPASSRDRGYSPARPYVTPRSGPAGPPEDTAAYEPRRSRDRRDDEDDPDSFPYSQPASERSARGRAR